MKLLRLPRTGCCLAITLFLGLSTSHAKILSLETFSVRPNTTQQVVDFSLTFDRTPDFNTYDATGRQADGFWIDFLNNPGTQPALNGFGGENFRILSTTAPMGGTPVSGFFSFTTPRNQGTQVTSSFPYLLSGSTVTFSATYSQLHETNGYFEAILLTDQYGASSATGTHIAGPGTVPEPSVFLSVTAGMFILCFAYRRKQIVSQIEC